MYNFGSLITSSLHEKNSTYLARLDQKLLENEENAAINYILDHQVEFGETPSIEFSKTKDELFEHIRPIKPKDCIAAVFDDAVDWLIARRGMNVIADIQETYAVNGKFPVEMYMESAQFLGGISKQENVSLQNCDMETIYGDVPPGLMFGWAIVDGQTGGVLPGELVIIGARPGVGKTQVVCEQAIRNARRGLRVSIFSLEMSMKHLTHRLHGIIGGFNPSIFRDRSPESAVKRNNLREIVAAELEIIASNGGDIIWPKKPLVTMGQIEAEVKENDPDIVIIDGMYLIPGTGGRKQKWEIIAEHSNRLKQMAMNSRPGGIPVIATTQLNRAGATDPKLEDIAFSDSTGQDSDLALSLSKPDGSVGVIVNIMKSRHGPSFGTAELHLDWSKSTVKERKILIDRNVIAIGGE